MSMEDSGKTCVVHFAGTADTVTVRGDWFDDMVRKGTAREFQLGDGILLNMANVTFIEVVDDGE